MPVTDTFLLPFLNSYLFFLGGDKMKNLLLIINPNAGRGQVKNSLLEIIDTFVKADYIVNVYTTQKRLDACEAIASKANNCDVIVACGGDGTLNECVKGLMDSSLNEKCILGYIPAGTTNDFANSHSIPKNMLQATEIISKCDPFKFDIGKFGERYFTYIAAFGAFTDVPYETPQNPKSIFGYAAYIMEAVKRLPSLKPQRIKAECDGKIIEDDFIFGMVSNSKYIAGVKCALVFDISLTDGLFEVLLIKYPSSPIEVQTIIGELLTQDLKSEHFVFLKSSCIKFSSEEEVPWTLDGEFGGKHTDITVENLKGAISLITDNHSEE